MTSPADYPLDLYRGDTFRINVVCWADAGKTQPLNLVGVTARAEIRDTEGGSAVSPMTCTVNAGTSTIVCYLPAASSKILPLTGVWDLQLTYPSGDVLSIVRGAVHVTADVTGSG